ncbi:MAG: 30S ribosomal protein S12 methylthiotransferase RimO [Oscillospiraceae bacterium]|nr:30S ribosomal protein S12 methylthiotransferase RimO [Oscillospiraceae bacterium]
MSEKTKTAQTKIAMVSLGCAKNQVDAELMLYKLNEAGYAFAEEPGLSDITILHTCGFITEAKQEAIEWLNELITLKNEGTIKKICVTGCLSERYREEFEKEYPEVDGIVGISEYSDIAEIIRKIENGEKVVVFGDKEKHTMEGGRVLSTAPYYAYLRVADGCDNCCTYCAIPQIRGRFRSRTMENILNDARELSESGVKEIILIAQDTTRYGLDLYGRLALPELLNKLCELDFKWIRLLYCYPERITDELISVIKTQPKIVKYMDIPIQHCDGEILKRMNRKGDENSLRELIAKLRREIPGITLRTTFITGFPGETEEQFNRLGEFAQEMRFDRMGCFAYSEEENTPAAKYPDQVDEEVREHRKEILEEQQDTRVEEAFKNMIGETAEVVVEGYDRFIGYYFGRSAAFAPEIDGMIYFKANKQPSVGDFINVKYVRVVNNNLVGEAVE